MQALIDSMKPVKDTITQEETALAIAGETPLQKKFDNRVGPSVNGSPAIDYHVYSPAQPGDTTRYPVLIWLHGMGQGRRFREPLRGTQVANFASAEYQAKFGKGAYIVVPRANEDLGMVDTIRYWLYSNSWLRGQEENGVSNQLPELVAAVQQFLSEESKNIDTSRVYLAGFSAGGYMTWQTLFAMPNTFAKAMPICQARFVPSHAQLKTVAHVPLWLVCGKEDEFYKADVAPTLEKLQTTHTAEVRATIFDTVYGPDKAEAKSHHASWIPVTYDMFYDDGTPCDPKYPQGFISWLANK